MVEWRRLLRGLRPEFPGLEWRREGRPPGARLAARLPERRRPEDDHRPRRGRALAHAGVRLPELPRLRRHRLREGEPRLRLGRRSGKADRRGAQARDEGDRRPGPEPHVEPAPLVPGIGLVAHRLEARLVRLAPGRPGMGPALELGPEHLARARRRLLLRDLLERDAGPQLPECGGAGGGEAHRPALAGPGRGRVPARCRPAPHRDRPWPGPSSRRSPRR
jgi:hypothetical protein